MALEKPLRPQLIACASVIAFATPVALSTTGAVRNHYTDMAASSRRYQAVNEG